MFVGGLFWFDVFLLVEKCVGEERDVGILVVGGVGFWCWWIVGIGVLVSD